MDIEDEPVDVSVLEALIEVRKQQELVDQFCHRADEMKEKVAAPVYERVLADYAKRRQVLEREAAPLVTRALGEYRKLRAHHDRVNRTHEAARLDKDEVDFRHSLGEIDDATRSDRLVAPERVLAESAAELATLDAQDARFREALPDVDINAIIAEPVAETVAPALVAAGGQSAGGGLSQEKTAWLPDPSPPPPPPIPFPQRGSGASAAAAEAPAAVAPKGNEMVTMTDGVIFAADEGPGGLLGVGEAALVSEADEGRSVNYQLTALTYIGRAEDNQIRILDPGISRRHVLITATPTGYTIRDLKSQNGTYLNGERIEEKILADGDRITLGEVTLVFRRVSPAATSAPASS